MTTVSNEFERTCGTCYLPSVCNLDLHIIESCGMEVVKCAIGNRTATKPTDPRSTERKGYSLQSREKHRLMICYDDVYGIIPEGKITLFGSIIRLSNVKDMAY